MEPSALTRRGARHIRVLSTTRAGDPSAPTIRRGRHVMSYSPGLDAGEVQALHDHHAGPEQGVVGGEVLALDTSRSRGSRSPRA